MKVKMVQQMSGTRHDGKPWPGPGNEFEVDDDEGAGLVHNRIAVPVAAEHRTREERRPDPADPSVETRAAAPAKAPAKEEDEVKPRTRKA